MLIDVSARKRANADAQRLAAIVESSDDAIVSKDLDGTITSWNRGAERVFGYLAEDVIGKPITILIPPDRMNEEPEIIERVRRGERWQAIKKPRPTNSLRAFRFFVGPSSTRCRQPVSEASRESA
jgi:PAS domain-containing protein